MKKLLFFFLLFNHALILASPPLHPKQVVEIVLKALSKRDMHTYYTHLTLDSRKKLYQSLMHKVFLMKMILNGMIIAVSFQYLRMLP